MEGKDFIEICEKFSKDDKIRTINMKDIKKSDLDIKIPSISIVKNQKPLHEITIAKILRRIDKILAFSKQKNIKYAIFGSTILYMLIDNFDDNFMFPINIAFLNLTKNEIKLLVKNLELGITNKCNKYYKDGFYYIYTQLFSDRYKFILKILLKEISDYNDLIPILNPSCLKLFIKNDDDKIYCSNSAIYSISNRIIWFSKTLKIWENEYLICLYYGFKLILPNLDLSKFLYFPYGKNLIPNYIKNSNLIVDYNCDFMDIFKVEDVEDVEDEGDEYEEKYLFHEDFYGDSYISTPNQIDEDLFQELLHIRFYMIYFYNDIVSQNILDFDDLDYLIFGVNKNLVKKIIDIKDVQKRNRILEYVYQLLGTKNLQITKVVYDDFINYLDKNLLKKNFNYKKIYIAILDKINKNAYIKYIPSHGTFLKYKYIFELLKSDIFLCKDDNTIVKYIKILKKISVFELIEIIINYSVSEIYFPFIPEFFSLITNFS